MKKLMVTKTDQDDLLGTFLDETHYDTLIDEDCDVYEQSIVDSQTFNEKNVVLMFRKNWFTKEQQEGAYDGLMEAAQPTQNRGMAAGPKGSKLLGRDWLSPEQAGILNFLSKVEALPNVQDIEWVKANAARDPTPRGMVWLSSEKEKHGFDWNKFMENVMSPLHTPAIVRRLANFVLDNLISDTSYANPVDSGIAGWFGRYPRIPYGRATAYTNHNRQQFELSYPFLRQLAKGFQELLPVRYNEQINCADKLDPGFRVPGTPFTTITVNKNFRTAAHRDAGDLARGFSNLTVVSKTKNYTGGYLVLPEIRAAVNLRPGDLLLVANHDYIHGNTPIVSPEVGELERISLVCYFREDMLELGSVEYENERFQFVEQRRKNSDHKLWRDGWNGVSGGMWESEEWYDFLKSRGHEDMLHKYHPDSQKQDNIEDLLFG
jgi:hypothetical protein